jgi:hypothetical protein
MQDTHTQGSSVSRWPALLREPLLHFAIIGALIFGADYYLVGRASDPHTIIVTPDIDKQLAEVFVNARGRQPTPEELRAARKAWLDGEVLYREGLALSMDKGDPDIRDRIAFKALGVIETSVKVPTPDDATLRAWFEKNRGKFDAPGRISFEEAALDGENGEAAVRAFVASLRKGTPGDAKAGLRVFRNRPVPTIDQAYGPDFTKALSALPGNEWTALQTRDGWRAIRVTGSIPAAPADFDARHSDITQSWRDSVAAEQRTNAVRTLARKYRVRYHGTTP